MVFLYDWKRWQIVANADNSYHKQKMFFSKYPNMYPTWLSKSFIYYYFINLLRLANILKLLVK